MYCELQLNVIDWQLHGAHSLWNPVLGGYMVIG